MKTLTGLLVFSVIAKATNFAGSNLQGCRFYKAYLVKANFEGSDLRGAALEDTSMDEANLGGANAAAAYFSASIMDARNLENADFTDASFPSKTLALLCERPDVKGTNPATSYRGGYARFSHVELTLQRIKLVRERLYMI